MGRLLLITALLAGCVADPVEVETGTYRLSPAIDDCLFLDVLASDDPEALLCDQWFQLAWRDGSACAEEWCLDPVAPGLLWVDGSEATLISGD